MLRCVVSGIHVPPRVRDMLMLDDKGLPMPWRRGWG